MPVSRIEAPVGLSSWAVDGVAKIPERNPTGHPRTRALTYQLTRMRRGEEILYITSTYDYLVELQGDSLQTTLNQLEEDVRSQRERFEALSEREQNVFRRLYFVVENSRHRRALPFEAYLTQEFMRNLFDPNQV